MGRVRGAVPLAVAFALVLGAVGLLGYSRTLNPIDALLGRGALVALPDLTGDPRPRAEAELEDLRLEIEIEEQFSLEGPRGTVVGQDPEPGERLREGDTVTLVISKGANRVLMPDAVGEPFDEIAIPFEEADIPLQVERVPSLRVDAGVVMEQSPGPGIAVTGLDPVRFVVSDGPAPRPVPDVRGRTLDAAAFEVGRSGLALGEVTFSDDPTVPAGGVVSADPAIGEVVRVDTPVDLVVSAGPEPVRVPDLAGRTEETARQALEGAGFVVSLAAQLLAPGERGLGTVFEQYPDPGTLHRPGLTVTLVVGRELPAPPPPRATTTTTTSTTTTTPTTSTTEPRRR